MISALDWNCKQRSECYLAYIKRMAREKEQFENDRAIKQSNKEWLKEYDMERNKRGNMGRSKR